MLSAGVRVLALDWELTCDARVAESVYQAMSALDPAVTRMRKALESIARNTCCDTCREAALVAQAALRAP